MRACKTRGQDTDGVTAPECVFNERHGVFYTGTCCFSHAGRSARRFSARPHIYGSVTCSDRRVHAVAEMSQTADSRFSQTQKYPIGRRHGVRRLAANGLKGPRKRRKRRKRFSLHLSQENIHSHAPLHLASITPKNVWLKTRFLMDQQLRPVFN